MEEWEDFIGCNGYHDAMINDFFSYGGVLYIHFSMSTTAGHTITDAPQNKASRFYAKKTQRQYSK